DGGQASRGRGRASAGRGGAPSRGQGGGAGGQGDGLDALARQVGQQPSAVGMQVFHGRAIHETRLEGPQGGGEGRSQSQDLFGSHRLPPPGVSGRPAGGQKESGGEFT